MKISAKILHEIFPVLKCYENFYMEYCQLITDATYISITIIHVTISCYIVTCLIINSVLE